MKRYRIPAETTRVETEVSRSRFIATLGNVPTVDAARQFIATIRAEMSDASHHPYAFKVGYGSSVVEGVSDDGEPTGTSGPPILSVLRGAQLGDVVIVVTRYFGGTKLGTGGLVRAYGDAAKAVLAAAPTREKITLKQLGLTLSYPYYERAKLIAAQYDAIIDDETFEGDVTLYLTIPEEAVAGFSSAIKELTAGRSIPTILD